MPRDTGFPRAEAENDFLRARRRQVMSRLAGWLRREPDDVNIMLPFHEVVESLGMLGERRLGLRAVRLDSIVGSVDRTRDFDRRFRPTSTRVRERWQRLALPLEGEGHRRLRGQGGQRWGGGLQCVHAFTVRLPAFWQQPQDPAMWASTESPCSLSVLVVLRGFCTVQ